MKNKAQDKKVEQTESETVRDVFLVALGERVRRLRARRGMTRKELARAASVSERHLANLEHGVGNVSILVLQSIANAFNCALAELIGDFTTSSPEWLLIRELLEGRSENDLQLARQALSELFEGRPAMPPRNRLRQIALIGLRGAGKSTLGRMLAADIGYPFIELSSEIERVAGCGILEIHSLYGATAYRRYERRALEEALQLYPDMVLATPGGLVSEPSTMNLMLSHCYSVWVKATPEDHMARVMAQGDFRPMAGNNEAMADLKRILASREAFYSKADFICSTSNQSLEESFNILRNHIREVAGMPRQAA
ncbi:MAG TPA: helix-turn-helix transcriptional regulator [Pusillimonas sp.]|uniref:helix-turn-helix transcriptional regulator n=1 Tax=unclassified Pusillimonas TaxID=2640016 RepID=UPI0026270734|nr:MULTISPECIES: helix-turn-helix transcriptional regulator [unclassified Pusillimonas]HLU19670.1 helix-turn-helix transcriptional regulator [Pusillimonas sp.]